MTLRLECPKAPPWLRHHQLPQSVSSSTSRKSKGILFLLTLCLLSIITIIILQLSIIANPFHTTSKLLDSHTTWDTPVPISTSALHGLPTRENRTHPVLPDWARPYAYAALATRYNDTKRGMQLFISAQGISLYSFGYELRVIACSVGKDLYPRVMAFSGLYACNVPREIALGERVSIVLEVTDTLRNIMHGRTAPRGRSKAFLREGDLVTLGEEFERFGYLKEIPREKLVLVRSEITWKGQVYPKEKDGKERVLVGSRYEVCTMTQEKLFPHLVEPWVKYHHQLGVDHFMIYDNNASQSIAHIFKDVPYVEIIFWPWPKSQVQAQNHFLVYARRVCEWAILIDVDEYVMVGNGAARYKSKLTQPLKQHLGRFREQGYSQVYMPEIFMGSSGHHYTPEEEAVPEAYTHYDEKRTGMRGKVAVWTDGVKPQSFVHRVDILPAHRKHIPRRVHPTKNTLSDSELYSVHFSDRSWEEHVLKRQGPRNSIMVPESRNNPGNRGLHIDRPHQSFLSMSNMKEFIVFRDYWKKVMSMPQVETETLVRYSSGLRCVATRGHGQNDTLGSATCKSTKRTDVNQEALAAARTYR